MHLEWRTVALRSNITRLHRSEIHIFRICVISVICGKNYLGRSDSTLGQYLAVDPGVDVSAAHDKTDFLSFESILSSNMHRAKDHRLARISGLRTESRSQSFTIFSSETSMISVYTLFNDRPVEIPDRDRSRTVGDRLGLGFVANDLAGFQRTGSVVRR